MNFIVNSIEEHPDQDFGPVLELVIGSEYSLEKEKQVARFILDHRIQNDRYPSKALVEHTCDIELDSGQAFPAQDLLVVWKEKVRRRIVFRTGEMLQVAANDLVKNQKIDVQLRKDIDRLLQSDCEDDCPVNLKACSSIDLCQLQESKNHYDFGIADVDTVVTGIESGTLVTVCGFTGSFKTTTAISTAVFNAIKGRSTAILNIESPIRNIKIQALSCLSFSPYFQGDPIPAKSILKRTLTDVESEALVRLEDEFENLPGKIYLFGPSDVRGPLLTSIPSIMSYMADKGVNAFMVDHIQLFKYFRNDDRFGKSDVSTVDEVIRTITDQSVALAEKGYDFRGMVLSQANREGYGKAVRKGGRYDLSALAEYNELERSSAYVLFLFSSEELKSLNELRVQLSKHRNGDVIEDPVSVFCDPEYSVVGGFIDDEGSAFSSDMVRTLISSDFEF